MIIVLTGRMASGKSTLAKMLESKGYNRIITYTTRPPRAGEVNGVDYHFVTEEKFLKLREDGFFAETKSFKVENGDIWYYGSSKDSYVDNSVIVLEKIGLQQVILSGIKVMPIYLKIKTIDSYNQAVKRADDVEEVRRRVYADTVDFRGIEKICDLVIDNSGFKYSLDKMLDIITNLADKGVAAL